MTDVFESVAIVTGRPDAAALHAAVYQQLVPRMAERRIGFSSVGAIGGNTAVLLRGRQEDLPTGARPVGVAVDQEYEFRVAANVRVSRNGVHVHTYRHDTAGRMRWLHRQGHLHGFSLIEAIELETASVPVRRPGGKVLKMPVTTFSGRLRVTDGGKFAAVLLSGLGKGRTWGFGLLHVKPIG